MNFSYRSYPNHVYFGAGKIKILPGLLKDYQKVMVIATERLAKYVEPLKTALGSAQVTWFSKVVQHIPESLVSEATIFREKQHPDIIVAIGGGSAIGLAKAMALEKYIPQVVIPTTFSGSEQTNIYGISAGGVKKTGRDDKVLPGIVIYDPALFLTMPRDLAVTSAMNAMAHLMESMYSPSENPVTRNNAMLGMNTIKIGIEELALTVSLTESAIEKLMFGSFLAGKCLCEVEMALHHKVAHVLGGSFGMEHSTVHTVLQSYVLAYQWPYLSQEIQNDFKQVLKSGHPPRALKELAERAGAKTDLKSIGFREEDIEKAAEIIISKPYVNVAPVAKEKIVRMLSDAYIGKID